VAQLGEFFRGVDTADVLGETNLSRKIKELLCAFHAITSILDGFPYPAATLRVQVIQALTTGSMQGGRTHKLPILL
jgi:hypothetical protein